MNGNSTHLLSWRVAPHATREAAPDQWISAIVPGAVQLDWARAHGWPEYWKAENYRAYDGLEDRFWTYESCFMAPDFSADERLFFVCGGVDYAFEISVNGDVLHSQEGMFTPVAIDISERVLRGGENVLCVIVHPAPKSVPAPADRAQANHSCKPAMSYLWDFHPRLIPLGIWQEAFLEVRPACHFKMAAVDYTLAPDFSRAELTARIELAAPLPSGASVRWVLRAPSGEACFLAHHFVARGMKESAVSLEHLLHSPILWWPHDHGLPALYSSVVEILDSKGRVLDSRAQRIGFRRVRLVMAPGQWQWSDVFPKTRSAPPFTLEINGRSLFAKGANWVSPEIFPGLLSRETCVALLDLARGAHMNILRMWGGAPAQKEFFYERCDALGIMVWQEFPLACNCYPDDPAYLRVLDQESRSLIARLKPHACVVMWCGGNELFNHWSGMTDQALPLRLLASNCFQLDPARPFLPTSPVEGVGHGHYVFRDPQTNEEAWSLFQNAKCSAYTEFGVSGPASLDVIREIIPDQELFPIRAGGSWSAHHALGVWMEGSHLYPDVLEYYFGPSSSLEQTLERGQLLQSEGTKGLFEESRRQKPHSSMALCWCFNEPWPSAANLSIISWPARPKPVYAAVAEACRILLASARIRKFEWHEGEIFDAELWWLNDAVTPQSPGDIVPVVESDTGQRFELSPWKYEAELPANMNQCGPKLAWEIPALGKNCERFTLILRTPQNLAWESRYTLRYRGR